MANAERHIKVKLIVDVSALIDGLDEMRAAAVKLRDKQLLSVLAEHGIEGEEATTSLATLQRSIDEGAPAPTDASLHLDALNDEQLTTKFAKWYGQDAARAAVILYRFGR